MARRRSERYEVNKKYEEEGNHYWMSYSDLMSALLLMFALLLMVNIYDNQQGMEKKDEVIQEVIGLKTQIIEELGKSFKDSNLEMEIDPQTGAIRFSSGVFFDYNSSTVSPEGKQRLEEFVPKYISILLSDKFKEHVSQIIVEGHTDQNGSYIYNMNLSQNRSFAVVSEILSDNFKQFEHRDQLQTLITSNGRSFSEPILNSAGQIDPDKSRRVEFKFRLKDEEMFKKIQEMVNEDE